MFSKSNKINVYFDKKEYLNQKIIDFIHKSFHIVLFYFFIINTLE